ncbi:MAG: efflux RND transporter periplasmic adaptor subunit [Xanthomonadales bacterium]|nr:efflux RND transporter periplasmic adaptor subunit [Xanthomonadales bacterium]
MPLPLPDSLISGAPKSRRPRLIIAAIALIVTAVVIFTQRGGQEGIAAGSVASRPALTVTLTTPQSSDWPRRLPAQGSIAAWQEAVIGAELAGLRMTEVLVNVGDHVSKGQELARLSIDMVTADVAQARASVAEAAASLADARATAKRNLDLQAKGFISPQALTQAETNEQTAVARLAAAHARLQAEEVRLAQTRVLAPDDGVISERNATVGSLTQPGQELFRLIRGERLEWRAEVTSAEADQLQPGMPATLWLPSGVEIKGSVRMVAPTIDPATRTALVYVDLPLADARATLRAGTFARGEFELGRQTALNVPQSAVLMRDGFAYVFTVDEASKARQTKVTIGRRSGELIEITDGLDPASRIVVSGAGFLTDGDTVRVVEANSALTGAQ